MAAVIMGGDTTDGLKKYVRKLAGERVYGDLGEESFKSAKMEDGNECEPEALDWAEFTFDCTFQRGVCIEHPTIPYVAGTPDALGDRFVVEAKSPLFHVWYDTRERNEIPSQYRWQCRWQLWIAKALWGWTEGKFVNYHRKPRGFVIPFTVTDAEIAQMTERAAAVEAKVRACVKSLQETI
jgi:hypothetical protein